MRISLGLHREVRRELKSREESIGEPRPDQHAASSARTSAPGSVVDAKKKEIMPQATARRTSVVPADPAPVANTDSCATRSANALSRRNSSCVVRKPVPNRMNGTDIASSVSGDVRLRAISARQGTAMQAA